MSDKDYVRTLVKMLRDRGYSEKAIREIVRWYREEVEKIMIPWVKNILKVTISDYLFEDD